MKVTEIKYTLKSTINIGNFENVQPEYSLVVALEDGDDEDKAVTFAKNKVVQWTNTGYDELQTELHQLKGNG